MSDPFNARDTFSTSQGAVGIYRLSRLEDAGLLRVETLPTRFASCWKPCCEAATAIR